MERYNSHSRVLWITRTGILVALLITLQWATGFTQAFAGQYVTGSLVNCVLAVAALFGGFWSGAVVACVSPFFAFLLGIGPKLLAIVPCIALGNLAFVGVLCLVTKPAWKYGRILAAVAAAATKFLTLYVAVVKVVIPVLGAGLKPPQVAAFTVMFSWRQLVTALIGGALAFLLLPLLKKANKK